MGVCHLLEFDNKVIVTIQWAWNYFTSNRGARLITAPGEQPTVKLEEESETNRDRGLARAPS